MKIKLFTTNSSENVVNKDLKNEHDFTIVINNEIDIREPVVNIETTVDLRKYNYAYIDEFNRYYFIDRNSIECTNYGFYRIKLNTDVLMSFKEDILKTNAIVSRQEVKNQRYLIDNKKLQYAYKSVICKKFPNEISNDNFSYVLITS